MPGRDPGGFIITMLLGIAGSLIGGFIGQSLFGYGRAVNDSSDLTRPGFLMSLVLAIIGAIVLLAIYRLIRGRTTRFRFWNSSQTTGACNQQLAIHMSIL